MKAMSGFSRTSVWKTGDADDHRRDQHAVELRFAHDLDLAAQLVEIAGEAGQVARRHSCLAPSRTAAAMAGTRSAKGL